MRRKQNVVGKVSRGIGCLGPSLVPALVDPEFFFSKTSAFGQHPFLLTTSATCTRLSLSGVNFSSEILFLFPQDGLFLQLNSFWSWNFSSFNPFLLLSVIFLSLRSSCLHPLLLFFRIKSLKFNCELIILNIIL